ARRVPLTAPTVVGVVLGAVLGGTGTPSSVVHMLGSLTLQAATEPSGRSPGTRGHICPRVSGGTAALGDAAAPAPPPTRTAADTARRPAPSVSGRAACGRSGAEPYRIGAIVTR